MNFPALAFFLLSGPALADQPAPTDDPSWGRHLTSAERMLDEGSADQAEWLLLELSRERPSNGAARRLLGLTYERQHRYGKARAELEAAVRLDPSDQQAKDALERVQRRRGPGFFGAIGEWEPDSSGASGWQAEASYAGIDRLQLYAGAGYGDRYYYTRRRAYAKGYYFYSPTGYVKLSGGQKTYDYPVLTNPVPESNSYSDVPSFELEVGDEIAPSLRASVAYEYFRPTFFYAPASHAHNHKLSAELNYRVPGSPLNLRLLAAALRDPDTNATVIDSASGTLVTLEYAWHALIGGGLELNVDGLSWVVLAIPNPELDHSQSWALVTSLAARLHGPFSARADYIRGKYSDESWFRGQTSHVTTLTLGWQASSQIRLSAGFKVARRPSADDSGPFVTVRVHP
jgi:hypothetical protein